MTRENLLFSLQTDFMHFKDFLGRPLPSLMGNASSTDIVAIVCWSKATISILGDLVFIFQRDSLNSLNIYSQQRLLLRHALLFI